MPPFCRATPYVLSSQITGSGPARFTLAAFKAQAASAEIRAQGGLGGLLGRRIRRRKRVNMRTRILLALRQATLGLTIFCTV
jgi:hypothetical protein